MGRKELFIDALKNMIALNDIIKELGGDSVVTPVKLSEELCKYILNYNDKTEKNKCYDAMDGEEKVEIKATSSSKGTTTYNPKSIVNKYIWIYFDYDRRRISFKETHSLQCCEDLVSSKEVVELPINELKARKTIQLDKASWIDIKTISMDDLEEIKN